MWLPFRRDALLLRSMVHVSRLTPLTKQPVETPTLPSLLVGGILATVGGVAVAVVLFIITPAAERRVKKSEMINDRNYNEAIGTA